VIGHNHALGTRHCVGCHPLLQEEHVTEIPEHLLKRAREARRREGMADLLPEGYEKARQMDVILHAARRLRDDYRSGRYHVEEIGAILDVVEAVDVYDGTTPHPICPDGGACHHNCEITHCFRVESCGPLTGVYPNDEWPANVVHAFSMPREEMGG
jgi:hypothetical protein